MKGKSAEEDRLGTGSVSVERAGQKEMTGLPGRRDSRPGILSSRLQMLADMVTPGNRMVDVGCDHGYLSIELVRCGICPKAIAMDVRKGPLAAAEAHVAEYGLDDYISMRLSDGLAGYRKGEADTLVCAGMGGRLMERILGADLEKAGSLKELILQPQSEIPQFRAFLREKGFCIIDEDAVFEEGKYYFAIKAAYGKKDRKGKAEASTEPAAQSLYDQYGENLLRKKHPVLWQYLCQRQIYISKLENSLAASDTPKAGQRCEEVRQELAQIRQAFSYFREQQDRYS